MQREKHLFRSWYTLPRAQNFKNHIWISNSVGVKSPLWHLRINSFWHQLGYTLELSCWHLGITSFWLQIGSPLGLEITRYSFSGITLWFCWHLGINSFWRQIRSPLGFGIPLDSFSRIPLCFPPLGFTMLIRSWVTTYFPVGVLLYLYFLGELHQSPRYKIYQFSLDPVTNYIYTADLNNRLRVGWKKLPNLNFKLKFQTQTWISKTKIFSILLGNPGLWEIDSKGKRNKTISPCCCSEYMSSGVVFTSLEIILAR